MPAAPGGLSWSHSKPMCFACPLSMCSSALLAHSNNICLAGCTVYIRSVYLSSLIPRPHSHAALKNAALRNRQFSWVGYGRRVLTVLEHGVSKVGFHWACCLTDQQHSKDVCPNLLLTFTLIHKILLLGKHLSITTQPNIKSQLQQ